MEKRVLPSVFARTLARFITAMRAWNWAPRSIESYEQDLGLFFHWLTNETSIAALGHVTAETLGMYQIALLTTPKRDGAPLAAATQHRRLSAVKAFFRFLVAEGMLVVDPAASLQLPKIRHGIPHSLPSAKETIRLLESIDTSTPLGLRDRAILEVFYASGIRNSELGALTLADFDAEARTLFVRRGKGGKDRVVPLGPVATKIVSEYIAQARPKLLGSQSASQLFVSVRGKPLARANLTDLVKRASRHAGMKTIVRPHKLRHACATHMLKGGADIRHIQKLLGHASLASTQIYTRVEISDLKAVHRKFHPRERKR